MMKKQKPIVGEIVRVPLDENGNEIVRKAKRKPQIHLKKEPYVEPTTPRQKAALAALHCGREMFANQAEYDAFRTCETRFKKGQALETAVWGEWMDKMIKWASDRNLSAGKPIIDIYKLSTAINNKESWGQYWHANKKRVEKQLAGPAKSLQATHKNEEAKW